MWLKKSQNIDTELVKNMLNSGNDVAFAIQKIQGSVINPCAILEQICDGQNVPPFYMTVWSQMCSGYVDIPQQNMQSPVEQEPTGEPEQI